jgi:anaerobic selenocysteine-containing dehydrogenase
VKAPRGFRGYFDILHDPAFRLPRALEEQTIGADRFPLWAGPNGWQMACHNPTAIDAILTGRPYPVRAMYVSGNNILAMYPNTAKTIEALRALDFLVVAAQTLHPAAEFADIVLPKATSLEEEELFLLPSGPVLLYSRPAHEPLGQARTEIDIAVPLLDRLEARGALLNRVLPWRTQREFNAYMLE